jgi:hypothetical protein
MDVCRCWNSLLCCREEGFDSPASRHQDDRHPHNCNNSMSGSSLTQIDPTGEMPGENDWPRKLDITTEDDWYSVFEDPECRAKAMVLACAVKPPYEFQGTGGNSSMLCVCGLLVIPKPGTTDLWERVGSFFHCASPGDHRWWTEDMLQDVKAFGLA